MPKGIVVKAETPIRPKIRARPLSTRQDVRRELAKVYWMMRRGEVTSDTGRAFAYVLRQAGDVIGEIARDDQASRIAAIEERIAALHDRASA